MIILTSLNPRNNEVQLEAVKSWLPHGVVYSLNCAEESKELRRYEYKNVFMAITNRTMVGHFEKPYVGINALIDFAKVEDDDLLLINSDVAIESLPEFKKDGITIFTRHDYTESYRDSRPFIHGFDAFFIPKEFLNIFPQTIYGLGLPFFDLSIPYRAIVNKIPVYYPKGKHIYHKKHETRYSYELWEYVGRFFRWEFKMNETFDIPKITTEAMATIKSHLISY